MMAVTGLFAYNLTVLVPLLVRDVLGGDATSTGFAFTFLGLGGVVGGLALAAVIDGTARSHIIMGLVLAASLTAVALSPNLSLGYLFLVLLGAASVSFKSAAGSALQLGSEPQMRGRTVALYFLALAGTSPIGGPIQGWIAEVSSPRAGLALGALSTLAVSGWGYRHLRKRRDSTENRPASTTADTGLVESPPIVGTVDSRGQVGSESMAYGQDHLQPSSADRLQAPEGNDRADYI